MEIYTTIGEFPETIKTLNKSADTPIRVIIDSSSDKETHSIEGKLKKSKYPFLHSGFWDGEDTPTDLAENHDKYLYDEE